MDAFPVAGRCDLKVFFNALLLLQRIQKVLFSENQKTKLFDIGVAEWAQDSQGLPHLSHGLSGSSPHAIGKV